MWQPDSNVKFERFLHRLKQESEIVCTDDGIQIDSSARQPENADRPKTGRFEPDSNVKFERQVQPLKQESEIV
jgi:hypothetical protein